VKFLGAVSSLANTGGGDLLLGIEAKAGLATAVTGIAIPNVDNEKLRLEHLLADSIEPRLPRVEIQPIDCGTGRYVLVIRAHRSWLAPHRVTTNDKFYGRNSVGKYPLDVSELRTAFVLADSVAERIRNFRNDRLIKIAGGETSIPLYNNTAMIIHVIPFSTFAASQTIDVMQLLTNSNVIPSPPGRQAHSIDTLVNLDGFATVAKATDNKTHAYAQLFRTGAIEGVYALSCGDDGAPFLAGTGFENTVVDAVKNYLVFLNKTDMGLPMFIFLSFSGMRGCHLRVSTSFGSKGFYDAGPLQIDTIALPEVTIETNSPDAATALRTSFNTVWNAFGYPKSDKYNDKGEWLGIA
jgi:Schlafen, AlbA_2